MEPNPLGKPSRPHTAAIVWYAIKQNLPRRLPPIRSTSQGLSHLPDLCSDPRPIDNNRLHIGIHGRDGLLRELRCGSRDPHSFHQNSTVDLPIPSAPHFCPVLDRYKLGMSECCTLSDPCLDAVPPDDLTMNQAVESYRLQQIVCHQKLALIEVCNIVSCAAEMLFIVGEWAITAHGQRKRRSQTTH